MRIDLFDGKVATTPAMLASVERAITTALGRFDGLVRAVQVRIIEGAGRLTTQVTLHAHLCWRGHSTLVAHERSADFYAAIQSAARKLRRALMHVIGKGRARR